MLQNAVLLVLIRLDFGPLPRKVGPFLFHAHPGCRVLLVHAGCDELLLSAIVQVIANRHTVALGVGFHQLQGGIRFLSVLPELVSLLPHMVVVPPLLRHGDQLVTGHLAGLVPVLEGKQLRLRYRRIRRFWFRRRGFLAALRLVCRSRRLRP